MIPGIPSEEEPCVLMGGSRDGQEDMVACVGPQSPCDLKIYTEPFEKYYLNVINGERIKDAKGRWMLIFVEEE